MDAWKVSDAKQSCDKKSIGLKRGGGGVLSIHQMLIGGLSLVGRE